VSEASERATLRNGRLTSVGCADRYRCSSTAPNLKGGTTGSISQIAESERGIERERAGETGFLGGDKTAQLRASARYRHNHITGKQYTRGER